MKLNFRLSLLCFLAAGEKDEKQLGFEPFVPAAEGADGAEDEMQLASEPSVHTGRR